MSILESIAGSYGAAFNPTEQANWFIDRLLPATAIGRAGFRVVRTASSSITIPVVSGDPSAAYVAEGAPLPSSDPTGAFKVAQPHKVGATVTASNESLSDLSPAGELAEIIGSQLVRNIGFQMDVGLFSPTAITNGPTSLYLTPGIQTLTGTAPDASLDVYAQARGLLESAGASLQDLVVLLAPATFTSLSLLKRSATGLADANAPILSPDPSVAAPRSLYGMPVVTSVNCLAPSSGKVAYAVDKTQVIAVIRSDATVAVSEDAAFTSDSAVIRGTARWDLVVANPQAVVRITAT